MADTIRQRRLELRGRLVRLSLQRPLDDHQQVALDALNDLDDLANLMLGILRTQGTTPSHLSGMRSWLETRGYRTK